MLNKQIIALCTALCCSVAPAISQTPEKTQQDAMKEKRMEWVKGRTYVYCILGDKKDLDMNKLKAVGPIEELTQQQIFGY